MGMSTPVHAAATPLNTCRASRARRDAPVAQCCPTSATQHVTTFSVAEIRGLDSVSWCDATSGIWALLEADGAVHTGFSGRALAVVRSNKIVASSAIEAESLGAVVNVDVAVLPGPAVDADTEVSTLLVDARRPVQTRTQCRTFVNVHRTVTT